MKAVRRTLLAVTLAAAALAAVPAVSADTFPSGMVHIIVPSPPGGSNDFIARQLAARLQELWKQTVIVEYKPGAAQIIGTDFVAKSAPDGHTIGLMLNSHLINAHIRKDLPYDMLRDFSGVMLVGYQPLLVTTSATGPYKTLPQVIAAAKKSPGSISYATPGAGSPMHFTGEVIAKSQGVEFVHIPFKGGGQQQQDVLGGRVTMNIASLGTSLPFIEAGKLRPLAVLDAKRLPAFPDVPSLSETIPGFSAQSFIGLVVPKGTPRDVIQTLNASLRTVLQSPETAAALKKNGITTVASSPEELERYLQVEHARWGELVKKTGITAE